jgi:ABC-type polysaccharide/polyol phosphate transport system ATPase subunit
MADSNEIIIVNNVWKKYRVYQDKPTTLKEKVLYRSKGAFQDKWVLEDINISIEKGKMVALIGRNGSGKSTLLKIMTRILHPDKGTIQISGKVSSLLELGAGFHMDFTGRENIYMNASIFGLNRKEIDGIINEIINFAELGQYIDNPVRTYSSGMYMRLAFSIAVHVDPDVLLVDEILAVGDNAFQRKCINRIESFKEQGKTIVIVSHDNGIIERLCDEVYWIHDAKVKKRGNPRDIIRDYMDFLTDSEEKRLEIEHLENEKKNQLDKTKIENTEMETTEVEKTELETTEVETTKKTDANRWGNRSAEILKVKMYDENNMEKHVFLKGKIAKIIMEYKMDPKVIKGAVFGIGVFKLDGTCCYGTNTFIDKADIELGTVGTLTVHIDSLNLVQGDYYLDVGCHHIDGNAYDYIKKILTFSVHSYENDIGISYLPHSWKEGGLK